MSRGVLDAAEEAVEEGGSVGLVMFAGVSRSPTRMGMDSGPVAK